MRTRDRTLGRQRVVMLLSNPATFDQRPLKEARTLARAGNAVTVLAWDRDLETTSDSAYDDGLVIRRMRVGAGHGTPVFTVPKLLLFYGWCLAHLVLARVDVVHCHDVDTLPAGFAAKVLKLGRPKLVYDMHDLPEAFLRFFPLARLTQAIFLGSARKLADAILVVNDRFVAHLGKIGFKKEKLVVIMNAPPSASARSAKRHSDGFNVLYYGWLGEERGVKLLLEAVRGLRGVTLILAGRGELEGMVREEASKNPGVRFLGWLKMEALDPVISEADLIPSLYEPKTKNAQIATPGKLLTAMSLSIPSLVPAGTYQAEIVEKYRCGVVVDWMNAGEVRGAIERLSQDRPYYDELSRASYEAFVTSFSWEIMEQRLNALYGGFAAG
ncbi:MAG: glycosyltransferase family 4 protein [Nitrososphaerota archaeon]|nr:glycosyltransferase family 4 protein [Nitrososphaerota archaeon]